MANKYLLKILGMNAEKKNAIEEIQKLLSSEITSRRAIGRGTLTVDVDEILSSKAYAHYKEIAERIVNPTNPHTATPAK